MLSDNKIVEMKLTTKTPRHSTERKQKKRGNINWEKMMTQKIAEQYRKRTEESASQEAKKGVSMEDLEWQKLIKILRTAAVEACGKREKQTNPLINQHEEETMELEAEICEALRERNRLIGQTGDRTSQEYDIAKAREKSKLQIRVKTMGGKLMESISRRVSTSMSHGTN